MNEIIVKQEARTYHAGQFFTRTGKQIYVLTYIAGKVYMVTIGAMEAAWWNEGFKVQDPNKITHDEFVQICGVQYYQEFKPVDVTITIK